MRRSNARYFAVAALAAMALAACSSSSKGASPATTPAATNPPVTTAAPGTTAASGGGAKTVSLANSKYGKVLVDSKGLVLYVDENDKPGKPACTKTCLTIWPAVVAPASPTFGAGLTPAKYGSITLADGTKQLTVSGSPLYTFAGKPAGDVSGQGVGGFYVVQASGKKYDPGAASGS